MRRIKQIWAALDRNIFVGDRLEKNLSNIRYVAIIFTAAGFVMLGINIASGDYSVGMTSLVIILAGISILRCIAKRNRKAAMYNAIAAIILVFTYDIFFVDNGFAYLWTMLVPLALSYLFSVKAGVIVSFYFWLVFVLAFYSPLNAFVRGGYSDIVIARFPVLFLFHIIITGIVMIQYHRSILDQMDYEQDLQKAKKSAEQARESAEQARENAEQANMAKSSFLANMSHEIRTPINAVLGMNEMIQRESLKYKEIPIDSQDTLRSSFDNIYNYTENIENAGKGLLSIINEILDFSRIEAGRMKITEGEYQLSSLLNELYNMFLFKAREKKLQFTMEADKSLPNGLLGDEIRIRQIIINILNNAVKYTESGSVHLNVHTEEKIIPEKGQILHLVFSVRDTGIGIRQEDIEKLFMKFERVNLKHNSTIEGAGLGLTITRELLTMMNGEIRVQSTYGEGSTFTITIPQQIANCQPIGDIKSWSEKDNQNARSYQESFRAPEAHILIVDDTKMNLMVAEQLLKQTKIQIDTAENGAEALRLAGNLPYDLILMDQRMPGFSGSETLQRIRTQKNSPNLKTPAICLTANALLGARQQYLADGFADYLAKPIDGTELEQMVMRFLPEEKVEVIQKDNLQTKQSKPYTVKTDIFENEIDLYADLRAAGFNPASGLRYCQNDDSFYCTLLLDFGMNAEKRQEKLQNYYDKKEWKDYGIQIHALKSTSRMLGADTLSNIAGQLEEAAADGNENMINEKHGNMMLRYKNLAQACLRLDLEKTENSSDYENDKGRVYDRKFGNDEEILEFYPE